MAMASPRPSPKEREKISKNQSHLTIYSDKQKSPSLLERSWGEATAAIEKQINQSFEIRNYI